MLAMDIRALPLKENWVIGKPGQRCKATFPLFRAVGTENTSMVYFELDAGYELGRHTDSAEEVLMILEGTVEVTIGSESEVVSAGYVAVVPTMVPHNLRNVGEGLARVAGIFPEARLVATFDEEWQPDGTRVIDTDQILIPA